MLVLLGMVLMYIILKVMSTGKGESSAISEKFKALIKTQQATNLVRTNEFREIVKTSEFRSLLSVLAEDQLTAISKTLIG